MNAKTNKQLLQELILGIIIGVGSWWFVFMYLPTLGK